MADNEQDKEGKTEEPTEHRLQSAIEKGNVAASREVATFGPMLASLVVLFLLAKGTTLPLVNVLTGLIERPGEWSLATEGETEALLWAVMLEAAWYVLPAVLLLAVAGVASAAIQNQPRFVMERIEPKLSRISLKEGWSRLFGSHGLVEFLKSVFKLLLISAIAVNYLVTSRSDFINAMSMEPSALPQLLFRTCATLLSVFVIASLVLVVADYAWVRFKWRRDLRMSRQDVKDEMKQMEGDPLIKSRLRSLARDRARRRMMENVPKATLVIANPTHFAVALRYVRSEGGAPVVLAKGKDLVALRIRAIAEEKGIPVVEDKPLARSLYDAVEVDSVIPPEFYRAVAKIILFLTARGKIKQAV